MLLKSPQQLQQPQYPHAKQHMQHQVSTELETLNPHMQLQQPQHLHKAQHMQHQVSFTHLDILHFLESKPQMTTRSPCYSTSTSAVTAAPQR